MDQKGSVILPGDNAAGRGVMNEHEGLPSPRGMKMMPAKENNNKSNRYKCIFG
jgi:hypothetical protein